jgi:hypothetical protein
VQAVVQEVGGPVGQQRIALHLAEADAAAELAALDRLPRQRVHRPRGPHLPAPSPRSIAAAHSLFGRQV